MQDAAAENLLQLVSHVRYRGLPFSISRDVSMMRKNKACKSVLFFLFRSQLMYSEVLNQTGLLRGPGS